MLLIGTKVLSDQIYRNSFEIIESYDKSVEINPYPNWSYIPDNSHRILIIGGSWSSKTNVLLNLIKREEPDIEKIYMGIKKIKSRSYWLVFERQKFVI